MQSVVQVVESCRNYNAGSNPEITGRNAPQSKWCYHRALLVGTAERTPSLDITPQSPPAMEPRTDGKAIWSLVCGILSIGCFFVTAIPAIILGHMSRSSIRNSNGRLKGRGMALVGLILGYISMALLMVALTIAIPSYRNSQKVANESAAVRNVRTITVAEENFQSSNGRYGDLQALISARLLDASFIEGPKAGYSFTIENSGDDYTARATPISPAAGRYAYFSTADTIIRYSREPALAPSGKAGESVVE